jgi:hypothetical protein
MNHDKISKEVINGRNVYSIDVGNMDLDEGIRYMDDAYDKKYGLKIGSTYKKYKKDKLYFNIALGFLILSSIILVITKSYYGVL